MYKSIIISLFLIGLLITSTILPFSSTNINSNTAMAQEMGHFDDYNLDTNYNNYKIYKDYSDKENKYECQKGPMEGFFVSSPEFCKSKVTSDRDRDGETTPPSNPDTDGDGINNNVDNCPLVANPDQADTDNDGTGDLCETTPPITGVEPLAFSDLGYETGDITSGWEWGVSQAENVSPSSINLRTIDKSSTTLPSSPDPNGSRILEGTVNPSDTPIDSRSGGAVDGSPRAEVLHDQPFQIGTQNPLFTSVDEMWYHWYTLFPDSLTIPKDRFHVWTQFHQIPTSSTCYDNGVQEPCSGAIPLHFNLRDSTRDIPGPAGSNRDTQGPELQLNIIELNEQLSNENRFVTLWEEEVQLGGWYEFLLHVNWQKCNFLNAQGICEDNGDALVELWIKRPGETIFQQVVTENTTNARHYNMDVDGQAYTKQGLYTNSGVSQTIYHDGMEMAKCPSSHPYYHPNTQQCFTTPPS
jgi:Polysaccharide lyase/Thrombospondin type 3 repeat